MKCVVILDINDNHAFSVVDPYLAVVTDAFNFLLIKLELIIYCCFHHEYCARVINFNLAQC